MTAPTEKPNSTNVEFALDDLEGIGHLLCDISGADSPPNHHSLYFLGERTLTFARMIKAHLGQGEP